MAVLSPDDIESVDDSQSTPTTIDINDIVSVETPKPAPKQAPKPIALSDIESVEEAPAPHTPAEHNAAETRLRGGETSALQRGLPVVPLNGVTDPNSVKVTPAPARMVPPPPASSNALAHTFYAPNAVSDAVGGLVGKVVGATAVPGVSMVPLGPTTNPQNPPLPPPTAYTFGSGLSQIKKAISEVPGVSMVPLGPTSAPQNPVLPKDVGTQSVQTANDLIEGVFKTVTPAVEVAFGLDPIGVTTGLVKTWIGQQAGEKASAVVIDSPEGQRLVGNLAAVGVGSISATDVATKILKDAHDVAAKVRAFDAAHPEPAAGPDLKSAGAGKTPTAATGNKLPSAQLGLPPGPEGPGEAPQPPQTPPGLDLAQAVKDLATAPPNSPEAFTAMAALTKSGLTVPEITARVQAVNAKATPPSAPAAAVKGTILDQPTGTKAPEPIAVEDIQEVAEPHEFSSTQVNLPKAMAKAVTDLAATIPDDVLAEDGRETEPHVTLKFGLHADEPEAVRKILANEPPITATLGKTSVFKASETGNPYDVVKVDVDSPDLHRLNAKIAAATPNTDTHPDYKPHITLAYVKPGEGEKYAGDTSLEGKTVTFGTVLFSDKQREKHPIELSGGKPTATFFGYQPDETGQQGEPQYNIKGGPKDGSTVTGAKALEKLGITETPKTPPFDEWKATVKPGKPHPRGGDIVFQDGKITATVEQNKDGSWTKRVFVGAQLTTEGSGGDTRAEAVAAAKKAFDYDKAVQAHRATVPQRLGGTKPSAPKTKVAEMSDEDLANEILGDIAKEKGEEAPAAKVEEPPKATKGKLVPVRGADGSVQWTTHPVEEPAAVPSKAEEQTFGYYPKDADVEYKDADGKWKPTKTVSATNENGVTTVFHPSLRLQPMWPPGAPSVSTKVQAEPHELRPLGSKEEPAAPVKEKKPVTPQLPPAAGGAKYVVPSFASNEGQRTKSGPKVEYNAERHSINVSFKEKPAPEILSGLKADGFKWAKVNKLWYKSLPPKTSVYADEKKVAAALDLTRQSLGLPTHDQAMEQLAAADQADDKIKEAPKAEETEKAIRAKLIAERKAAKKDEPSLSERTPAPKLDPQDVVFLVKFVRSALKENPDAEFQQVVKLFHEEWGDGARDLDRAMELAWKKLTEQDVSVESALGLTEADEKPTREEEDDEPVDEHGAGELSERGAGVPRAGRTRREAALADVQSDAGEELGSEGAVSAGHGDSGRVVADGVRRHAGDVAEQPVEPTASGVDVPESVAVSPSGDTHDPGLKPHDYGLTPERIGAIIKRGPVVRAEDNLKAIKIVKALQAEQRWATPDEQEALAKYVGWGASDMAARLHDRENYNWSANEKRIWQELQDLLSEDERKALIRSTPNAHFTFDLYRPIWKVLTDAGFTGGRVLEPSVGTGHAFGFMPPDVRHESTLNGVELEPITAAIAHNLYPSARIQAMGYEQARIARGSQDLAIGNVPFGDFGVQDTLMPDYLTERIHNYFFAKALEHVRPGGLVVFLTSRYTMDGTKWTRVRKYLMTKAEFVGAVRLPNTAFDKSAKTEVISDVIVLRKLRDGETAKNAGLFVEVTDHPTLEGAYSNRSGKKDRIYRSKWYTEHPELIVGEETTEGSMRSSTEYTVTAKNADVAGGLEEALRQVLPTGSYQPQSEEEASEPVTKVVEGRFKPGELRVGTDKKRIVVVGTDGSISDATPKRVVKATGQSVPDEGAVERISGMIGIRDARTALVQAMQDKASSPADIKTLQSKLNHAYDRFVRPSSKDPNWLNKPVNKRLFKNDPEVATILALERIKTNATLSTDKNGKKVLRLTYDVVGKADIFTKRTIGADREVTHAATPKDALLASLGVRGHIDWSYMAKLFAGQAIPSKVREIQQALYDEGLVFQQPDGTSVIAEEYLSGDVVSKLEDVEAAHEPARFAKNIDALKAVQPEAKTIQDVMDGRVSIALGSHWINPEDLSRFVAEQLQVSQEGVSYKLSGTETLVRWDRNSDYRANAASDRHPLAVKYDLSDPSNPESRAKKTYGFLDLVDDALNLKVPHLGHYEGDRDHRYFVREPTAELAARANQESLRDAWRDFVYANTDVLDRMLGTFNTRFNRTVERMFDGSHMVYPGMATLYNEAGDEIHFFPHQNNGVWRILTSGNTLLAHEVGAGKTFEMIAAAMEMRRTGRASKPMITVPTYLLKQWEADIVRLYPNVKLLSFTEDDLASNKRQEAMSRISNGNWDIVLVPHSSFGLLKVSDERVMRVMQTWIDELKAMEDAGEKGSDSVKEMERQRRRIEDKVAKKAEKLNKGGDNALTWEQLGVDALFVDEAQAFKNLFFFSKVENVRGLSRSESDRSLDLYVKVLDLNEQSNYRNLVLATATPVMNSIAEIYTMQRYLQPQALKQFGVDNFDNWYTMFAQAVPTIERQPDGNYKEVMRLRKYQNLQLLSRMVRGVMDYIGWEDMPYLKLPKIKGGKIQIHQTEAHPMYPLVHDWFVDRMARLKANPPHINREGDYIAPHRYDPMTGNDMGRFDNILTVMTDAKKAAVDLRLVLGDRVKDWPGSRVQTAADEMVKVYKEEKARKGVVLMFLDMGTPKTPPPLTFLANVKVEDETDGELEEPTDADDDQLQGMVEGDTDSFNLYDALKAALVKRGVKPDEIAYIHQAKNPAERVALFQAANEGRIRFVFASTDKGGVGMNIQTRLAAIHEIDVPRAQRPGDLRQRMGRGIRQGNTYAEVGLDRYVTQGTTDEWLWGLISTKDMQIRQFYRGDVSNLEEDDPSTMSLEEAQIRASNDPRGIELTELKGKMARLEAQSGAAERAMASAKSDVANGTLKKTAATAELDTLDEWVKTSYTSKRGKGFEMSVGGKTYTNREEAESALMRAIAPVAAAEDKQARSAKVGDLGGLSIYAKFSGWNYERIESVTNSTGKKTGTKTVHEHSIQVELWINGTDVGADNPQPVVVRQTKLDDPETLGLGQNPVTSLTNMYEKFPEYASRRRETIAQADAQIAQGQRVLAHPSDSIEKFRAARDRVVALEQELKAESEEKGKIREAEDKLAAGEASQLEKALRAEDAEGAPEVIRATSKQKVYASGFVPPRIGRLDEPSFSTADEEQADRDIGPSAYHAMQPLPLADRLGAVLFDAGDRLTPEEREALADNPAFQRVSAASLAVLDDVMAQVLGDGQDTVEQTGVLLAKNIYGVYWPRPGTERHQATILLNPIEIMRDNSPDEAARLTYRTAVHEALHEQIIKDGPDFDVALADLLDRLGPEFAATHERRMMEAYAGSEDVGGYDREIPEVLRLYSTSRGRPGAAGQSGELEGRRAERFPTAASDEDALARDLRRDRKATPAGVRLQSTVLPGAAELGDLLTPAVERIAQGVRQDRHAIIGFLAPAKVGAAPIAAANIRAQVSARDQRMERARRTLNLIERGMDAWSHDESRAFWDVMEGLEDLDTLPKERQAVAALFRDILTTWRETLLDHDLLENYLENYWPHEWDRRHGTVTNAIRRLFGRRPIQGPESYRKKRTIPDTRTGLAFGLEPVSWNPATQLLLKIQEMNKSLAGRAILQDNKRDGVYQYVPEGKKRPEAISHWKQVPDYALGVVYGPRVEEQTFGRVIAGHYWAPVEVVRLLENHLSPGLMGKSLTFDTWRTAGGFLNKLQLGFSLFHLYLTGTESAVSKLALSLEQVSRGNFKAAAKAAVQVPVAPFVDLVEGHKALKAFYAMDADADLLDGIIGQVVQGGGGFGWCADAETEILTTHGWKRHQNVGVGDLAYTLNTKTGLGEWHPISAVNRFSGEWTLRHLSGRHHDSMTTANHRWPTKSQLSGRWRWKTTETLNTADVIVRGARSSGIPIAKTYDDDFVRLIAWFFTEGQWTGRKTNGKRGNSAIWQKRHPDLIAECLTGCFGPMTVGHLWNVTKTRRPAWGVAAHKSGCQRFALNNHATDLLRSVCDDSKAVSLSFVLALTADQLELFVNTALMADGHVTKTGQAKLTQKVPSRLVAFDLANTLLGRASVCFDYLKAARTAPNGSNLKSGVMHGVSVCRSYLESRPVFAARHPSGGSATDKWVHYSGVVWCPTVQNGTWYARRSGKPYFTGNSVFDKGGSPERVMRELRAAKGAVGRGEALPALGHVGTVAVKSIPAFVELLMKPVMEGWVPRLKMAAYLQRAQMEIERLGPEADLNTVRQVLGEAWDSIDNRFGEMRYDNLFWDNRFKQFLMAMVRAVGWNVGTIREMFGAIPAQVALTGRQLGVTTGGGGAGKPPIDLHKTSPEGEEPRRFDLPPEAALHPRMAWLLAMLIIHGMTAAILMYLATGTWPSDVKDWMYPQSGPHKRESLIDYFKDLYAMVKEGPLKVAANKLQPLLTLSYELIQNEDYYGVEIRDPDDPIGQQFIDDFKFIEQQYRPFTWTNAERRGTPGATLPQRLKEAALQAIRPTTPAPADIERTAAESLLHSWGLRERSVKTQQQAQISALTRTIRQGLAAGTPEGDAAVQAAIDSGQLTANQIKTALKSGVSDESYLEYGFKQQPLDRALKLYEVATPEERSILTPLLIEKANRLLQTAPPATQDQLLERLNRALDLPAVTVQ